MAVLFLASLDWCCVELSDRCWVALSRDKGRSSLHSQDGAFNTGTNGEQLVIVIPGKTYPFLMDHPRERLPRRQLPLHTDDLFYAEAQEGTAFSYLKEEMAGRLMC